MRKRWIRSIGLFVVFGTVAIAQRTEPMRQSGDYGPFPQPDAGYVTDHAGLLGTDQEESIEQLLWRAEKETGVEIVVVTIPSMGQYPGVGTRSIEDFARRLFDAYGIGNMPKNNGVLLLVSSGDRKARIELGAGYGRSRDADARRIMDRKILPAFRKGHYAKGIRSGVEGILLEFTGRRVVGLNDVLVWGGAAIALVLISISLFRSGKQGWGWIAVGLLLVVLVTLIRILAAILVSMAENPGHSSGWSSGGFGGGFGGGFSGGGGATGSW